MSILEVKGLSIRFGGVQALKDVSFSLEKGEFAGLMGPNGAGKTTLINCISKVYPASSGMVIFEGQDLLKLGPHEITTCGVSRTFQDLGFFNQIAEMSVLDYLKLGQHGFNPTSIFADGFGFGKSVRNEIELKRKARKVLEFFREIRESLEPPQEERGYPILLGRGGFADLIDAENSPISSLSFAWRRRLDLARAIVSRPKLLILDEPAQGLPPSEIENLGKILKIIKSELAVSALVVEHNVGMLMSISSKIIAMNFGEKVAEGTPEEINANPIVNEIYIGKSKQTDPKESLAVVEVPTKKSDRTPILDIRGIDLYYGQAQALNSVSLKLFPEQVACVLGTNGSGKSSLLKAVSGIEMPLNGEIILNGEYLPLGWPEVAVERGIQYVPQGHVIFPQLSVRQNLKIGGYTYEKRGMTPDIKRVFQYFPELERVMDSYANDLSGGQRQMLAIGQAIIGKPDILLLDEPSLGLSPKFVELLFDIIKEISRAEKCSVLIVEQNVTKALEISDYVYMLSAGLLISEGPASTYRANLSVIKKNLGFL